ncbi:MAG: hypothetical protein KDC49_07270 [Saprospiraceae bacterium]|nr:hypothetical protein [Saprospiraceae bacterium]
MIGRIKLQLLFSLLLACIYGNSQDIHFTYFEFAPQSVNPALNGLFAGSYRASGIFRDQYQNTGVQGYRTIEAAIDAPVIRGFRKQDWIGIGASFDKDTRGAFKFSDTYSRMGLTYHLALDAKQTRILSIGAQRNGVNRRLNIPTGSENTFVQLSGQNSDPDLNNLQQMAETGGSGAPAVQGSYSDWVGGLSFTNRTKQGQMMLGVAATHFLKENAAFTGTYNIPLRITGFFTYEGSINPKTSLEPGLIVQSQGDAFELSAHMVTGYKISQTSPLVVKGGLGFRTGTASAQVLLGAEYKNIKAGFAYDIPLSGYANASGIQNSIELGVSFIGIIKKTPKPDPIVTCPRL